MKERQASRTAQYMALFRALESVRPAGRRLFEDPFAERFLPAELRVVAALCRLQPVGDAVRAFVDRRWPGVRTSAVARTRWIDDVVRRALRRGAGQVVLLGAGFDARAYRIREMQGKAVFEVDHPSTSMLKRQVVEAALGVPPGHVRFVALDFNVDSLERAMTAAGFDPQIATVVVWEGVSNYLGEQAVDATIRWCGTLAAGSTVVFTYIHRDVLVRPEAFEGAAEVMRTLANAEEKWTFGLDPAELAAYLAERGLTLTKDVGAADYRAALYGPSATGMRGYEFYRIAVTRVGRPSERQTLET